MRQIIRGSDNMKKIIFGFIAILLVVMIVDITFSVNKRMYKELVIQDAEFPFRIEYEQDGVRHVIDDVLVVEGYRNLTSEREYLKSEGPDIGKYNSSMLFFKSDGLVKALELEENVLQEVWLILDSSRLMGWDEYNIETPRFFVRESYGEAINNPDSINGHRTLFLNKDELYDKFGIKVIAWKPPVPIENEIVIKTCYFCADRDVTGMEEVAQ
jgi:hypothetical protein